MMKKKVDNIDRFVVSIETKDSMIDAEINSLKSDQYWKKVK